MEDPVNKKLTRGQADFQGVESLDGVALLGTVDQAAQY